MFQNYNEIEEYINKIKLELPEIHRKLSISYNAYVSLEMMGSIDTIEFPEFDKLSVEYINLCPLLSHELMSAF